MNDVLFYTHCDTKYQRFVLPFAYFALMTSPDYLVEIWMPGANEQKGFDWLNKTFNGRAALVESDGVNPQMARFLVEPKTHAPHTYISDIDILTLDPHVREWHVANLDGRCFSNALRKPGPGETVPRLSGLMFVLSDAWYSLTAEARRKEYSGFDEMALAQVAFSVYPEAEAELRAKQWARPVHGIHMSAARDPSGTPGKRITNPGWEITTEWINALKQIEQHETWETFWKLADETWKQQYSRIF